MVGEKYSFLLEYRLYSNSRKVTNMIPHLRLKYPLLLALTAAFSLLLVTADAVLAHDRVEVGPYVLIVGWENEPPVVGDRNFLVIDITKAGEPVEQVEATLDLRVLYGGRTFTANLNPTSTPGHYRVDMYPTVRGQYTVEFTGLIEDLEVDIQSEPEEVLPASAIQFPEAPLETSALQTEIDDLASQLQTARLLAIAGIVVGVIGIAVGAAGLLLKRA
jgi:hypothetical protein